MELPARSWGRLHAERHIRDLGYELGTTENTIGATVVFTAIPTVALGLVLTWWVYRHPRRVAFAYAALTAWIAAVAAAGWALGHP